MCPAAEGISLQNCSLWSTYIYNTAFISSVRFFGTQSAHTSLQFSWGGQHCTLHREMSRLRATLVSLMRLSSLITDICMTHTVGVSGLLQVAHLSCHDCKHCITSTPVSVTLHVFHTPSLTGYEFWQHKTFHMHKLKHTVYFTQFAVALISLNWLLGDATPTAFSWLYDQHWTVTQRHS